MFTYPKFETLHLLISNSQSLTPPTPPTWKIKDCSLCLWICLFHQCSSVQSLSRVWLFATPWTAAHQASLSITNSRSLLNLMSIESVMPSNHLIRCHPLLLPPSIFHSISVFSNESVLHIRWPKYWSFSFIISPYKQYWGLISFRMDWLDLLAVQGTLESSPTPQLIACFIDLFICVVFQISHISYIICYFSFSFWLTPLCMIVSRSFHVAENGTTSFLFMAE